MPTKEVYVSRDLAWTACCRAAYEKIVARDASGYALDADMRRLPEILDVIELTPMDFQNDVMAASEGKPPRRWDGPSPVIVTQEEDLPEGEYEIAG